MQTSIIAEARELIGFALQIISGLRSAAGRLSQADDDEQSWLAAAERRIQSAVGSVEAALEAAADLPEFEAERQKKAAALFDAWVDAVEGLHIAICSNASPNSPLIEVLFPHQKLDKLRKPGAQARAYMADLERRRRTSYILRLSSEPEYAFLRERLEQLDAAKAALDRQEQPIELGEDEQAALREPVRAAADTLRSVLSQARLLAEAALLPHPGWLADLGLDQRPRKRSSRAPGVGDAGRADAVAAPAHGDGV